MAEFQFTPFTQDFAQDPYSVYALMREDYPIYFHEDWQMHLLSRYEDIATLVNDSRLLRTLDHLYSEEELNVRRKAENWEQTPCLSRYVRINILDSEGEYHDRLRRLVYKIFTPTMVSGLRSEIEQIVLKRIAELQDSVEIDFIEDFAAQFPGFVIGMLLGVPATDRPKLRLWSERIVRFFEPEKTEEDVLVAEQSTAEFAEFLKQLAERRRFRPEQDLISELVVAEEQGELSQDELISTCIIILAAGHGSTIDVAGNGMLALLRNPDQLNKLRSNYAHIQSTVQEMFRYDAPLPFFHRFAGEDISYKDHEFPAGCKIGVLYGSANRDEQHFSHASQFDITRMPNRHLAFGIGSHFCLGNHLARLNLDIMFTQFVQNFSHIELAENEPQFRQGLSSRGLNRLSVSIK